MARAVESGLSPRMRTEPALGNVTVNVEKAREWLSKGATPTETVTALLKRAGV